MRFKAERNWEGRWIVRYGDTGSAAFSNRGFIVASSRIAGDFTTGHWTDHTCLFDAADKVRRAHGKRWGARWSDLKCQRLEQVCQLANAAYDRWHQDPPARDMAFFERVKP